MSYDWPMSDMPPPPPGPGQQGYGAQGGADVWGDDTNGRAGFGNRLGSYLLDVVLYGTVMIVLVSIASLMFVTDLLEDDASRCG